MKKKLFGLSVRQTVDENGLSFNSLTSSFLICVSSDEEKLKSFCDTLQKAADLMFDLLPNRGYHSFYRVDEVNFLDL